MGNSPVVGWEAYTNWGGSFINTRRAPAHVRHYTIWFSLDHASALAHRSLLEHRLPVRRERWGAVARRWRIYLASFVADNGSFLGSSAPSTEWIAIEFPRDAIFCEPSPHPRGKPFLQTLLALPVDLCNLIESYAWRPEPVFNKKRRAWAVHFERTRYK